MIHWELCKKFKFDHRNIWYMHNPASVLENEKRKHIWDFDIQISARRPDLIKMNKKKKKKKEEKTCKIVDFAVHRESEKKYKFIDFAKELKKL